MSRKVENGLRGRELAKLTSFPSTRVKMLKNSEIYLLSVEEPEIGVIEKWRLIFGRLICGSSEAVKHNGLRNHARRGSLVQVQPTALFIKLLS